MMRLRSTANLTDQDWNAVMNVNARGVFYALRGQLSNIKDGGSIVNVASVAAMLGLSGCPAYVASKHAVAGLTKNTANDYGCRNIRVTAVAPGMTEIAMLSSVEESFEGDMAFAAQALKRKGKPEEIAHVIVSLLSDETSFVIGALWPVDSGWTA
ncbi:uncharacterized protein A1O5_02153 [Cladophialophora psammophila CBS 110553]|uniref:3-oxoacyl-[acyl-carrier protein] reductase n=1 Tax=Cladophialophora psammophila CBS 110553 TaxID=1182543 RepID=W9X4N1_9EURO|nr:uncharacterized protein A1O5_02153 [Cladophialophora psammophila CBS 110553]EXJ75457.1 hypothetical protein A1O5_02153 [Cladophialophora psammophila CBS 110553]